MAAYLNLRARYSKGTLKLQEPLKLPEGTEVRVTVKPLAHKRLRSHRRRYLYPTRPLPPGTLARITGLVSLGGDALADSEALYDGD